MQAKILVIVLGFFSLGMMMMTDVLIPLWAHHLGYGPFQVGLVVGAGSILPTVLAISAGSICDKVGPRFVMLIAAVGTAVTGILYPWLTLPLFLFLLQLPAGLFRTFAWIAAQVYSTMDEDPVQRNANLGLLSFGVNLGSLFFPVLVGILVGREAYFLSFVVLVISAVLFMFVALRLPRRRMGTSNIRWTELVHPVADIIEAVRVLKEPGVGLVMTGTFIRLMITGLRQSFYLIYILSIGLAAETTGVILFFIAAVGIVAAPAVMVLARKFELESILVAVLLCATFAVVTTPFIHSLPGLLPGAAAMGIGAGGSLPLLLALLGKYTSPDVRGLAIGMRTTFNQFAMLASPVLFGAVAELFGLRGGFFVVGGGLFLLAIATGFMRPKLDRVEASTSGT